VHLSSIAEELVYWSSQEFGFVEMDDRYTTGSSIMPQKKNPDITELIRGRTGSVIGTLVNMLIMEKGLPLSYNRDLQEDKRPLMDSMESLTQSLTILAPVITTAKFNKEHLYEVKCLTERFSLNSKPVIVYTSTQAVENGKITGSLLAVKNRARAMGIHLVDLNDLKGPLGEKLVRIATGQDLP
jgi:argininosuccinate lyase